MGQHYKSMAQCKTAVSPLLMHWRYCSLALSHQNDFSWNENLWILIDFLFDIISRDLTNVMNIVVDNNTTLNRQKVLIYSNYDPFCLHAPVHNQGSPWEADHWYWLLSLVTVGIWTSLSHMLIKISADKCPHKQLLVMFSLIMKPFCLAFAAHLSLNTTYHNLLIWQICFIFGIYDPTCCVVYCKT